MSWWYQDNPVEDIPEGAKSFVYKITNLQTGRAYIGFKLFYFAKSRVVKGKRKRYYEESDWKIYWSSSEELKSDVLKLGLSNFKREILHFCVNKAVGKYLELKEQMDNQVLEHPEMFYNSIVNARINRNHIKSLIKTSS